MKNKLSFGRTYSFYLKIKDAAAVQNPFYFDVSIVATKPLNPKTGMTVSLPGLDQIAKKRFKSGTAKGPLTAVLEKLVIQIKKDLKLLKSELVSIEFKEVRGYAISFQKNGVFFSRKDFATDAVGDLFEVTSTFDSIETLKRIRIKNFKSQITEEIIF